MFRKVVINFKGRQVRIWANTANCNIYSITSTVHSTPRHGYENEGSNCDYIFSGWYNISEEYFGVDRSAPPDYIIGGKLYFHFPIQ
jgi:hypothetical protein